MCFDEDVDYLPEFEDPSPSILREMEQGRPEQRADGVDPLEARSYFRGNCTGTCGEELTTRGAPSAWLFWLLMRASR
jgi:hypothetical protein